MSAVAPTKRERDYRAEYAARKARQEAKAAAEAARADLEATPTLPDVQTVHRGRVTFHRPTIRQVISYVPTLVLGRVLWAGEETRTVRPAKKASVAAWVNNAHLETA